LTDLNKRSLRNRFQIIYGKSVFEFVSKLIIGSFFLFVIFIITAIIYSFFNLAKSTNNSINLLIIIIITLLCAFITYKFEPVLEVQLRKFEASLKLTYKNKYFNRELVNSIYLAAKIGEKYGDRQIDLLSSKLAAYNYVFLAGLIKEHLRNFKKPNILDWGCGYGQMIFILGRMGFNIEGIDIDLGIQNPPLGYRKIMDKMPIFFKLRNEGKISLKRDLISLKDYDEDQFDVILASGTWDQVNPNLRADIFKELKRTLRKDGLLINVILNKKYFINKLFKIFTGKFLVKQYDFSSDEFKAILLKNNFSLICNHVFSCLPRNFSPVPILRKLFNFAYTLVVEIDYYFLGNLRFLKGFCGKYLIIGRNLK